MSQDIQSYEAIAASQSNVVLGAVGAAGDYLDTITIVPATTSPGAVTIADGSGSAITIFTGGATSVADLKPFALHVKFKSGAGAIKVTTGANVSVLCTGSFT